MRIHHLKSSSHQLKSDKQAVFAFTKRKTQAHPINNSYGEDNSLDVISKNLSKSSLGITTSISSSQGMNH